MSDDPNDPLSQATTFDALVERVKRDVEAVDDPAARASHAARLQSIFAAALHEFEEKGAGVVAAAADKIEAGAETVRAEIRAHPVAAISGAFAAGYAVGRAIAGKVRK